MNDGTLRLRNLTSISLASLSGTGAGTFDFGNTTVTVGSNNANTAFSGTLTGSNTIIKIGTGTLTLTPTAGSEIFAINNNGSGDLIFDGGSITMLTGTTTLGLQTNNGGNITLQNGAQVTRATAGSGRAASFNGGEIRLTGAGTSLTNFFEFTAGNTTSSLVVENAASANVSVFVVGFADGANSTGTVRSGGSVVSSTTTVGVLAGATGTLTVSDAGTSLTAQNLSLGGFSTTQQGGVGHAIIRDGASAVVNNETRFWTQGSTLTIDRATLTTGRLVALNSTVPVVSITNPVGGTALTIGSGNLTGTFGGTIRDGDFGPGGVSKIGTGTVTLTGANTYTGVGTVSAGTLRLEGANRGSYHVTGTGTLDLNGVVHQLGFGFLQANSGRTITYRNGAQVFGGFLNGPGTHSIGSGGATFSGTTAFAGATINVNNAASFTNFSSEGNVNVNAPLSWNNGTNGGAGSLSVFFTLNATGFSNAGLITVHNGGVLNNSTTPLVSSGGGRITINTGGLLNLADGSTLNLFGSRLTNNGTIVGTTNVGYGALAKGTGTFGTVNVFDGGTFSPGSSPGAATLDAMTWGEAGEYLWEIFDAAGAAGVGYDTLDIAGELTITAGLTTLSKFTITVVSLNASHTAGPAINFDPYQHYTWVLATADGGMAGFDLDRIDLDLSGFANAIDGWFTLGIVGNQLVLNYTPVPEPAGLLAVVGLAAMAAASCRFRTPHTPAEIAA